MVLILRYAAAVSPPVETTAGGLSRPLPLSFAGVSKHLGVLERAGLLTHEARGRERACRLTTRPRSETLRTASTATYASRQSA